MSGEDVVCCCIVLIVVFGYAYWKWSGRAVSSREMRKFMTRQRKDSGFMVGQAMAQRTAPAPPPVPYRQPIPDPTWGMEMTVLCPACGVAVRGGCTVCPNCSTRLIPPG